MDEHHNWIGSVDWWTLCGDCSRAKDSVQAACCLYASSWPVMQCCSGQDQRDIISFRSHILTKSRSMCLSRKARVLLCFAVIAKRAHRLYALALQRSLYFEVFGGLEKNIVILMVYIYIPIEKTFAGKNPGIKFITSPEPNANVAFPLRSHLMTDTSANQPNQAHANARSMNASAMQKDTQPVPNAGRTF